MSLSEYPGKGRQLYLATYASGKTSQVTYPLTAAIPNGSLSDSEALNDAMVTTLSVTFAVAPGVATNIEYDLDPTFNNAYAIATLPISVNKIATWTNIDRLQGFIRINNTSGQTINSIFVQKQVSSFSA